MALLRLYIFISAIVIRSSVAQESNALLANWLAKETTDFERAELLRNNEVNICLYFLVALEKFAPI